MFCKNPQQRISGISALRGHIRTPLPHPSTYWNMSFKISHTSIHMWEKKKTKKKTISPSDSHYGPVHCRCVVECYSLIGTPPCPLILLSESLKRKKIGIAVHGCRTFHRRVPAIKSCYFLPRGLRRAVSYMRSSKYVGVQLLICRISSEAGMKTLCEWKGKEAVDKSCSHYSSVRI